MAAIENIVRLAGGSVNIESLSIDQMRAALAVAELGSFSGAARRFNRAQSAVSYAVTTLERQLGVALFDRTDGAKPQPTETGRVLLREMEAVVRRADEIKNQARDIGKGLEYELPITIDSLFPLDSLTNTLKEFQCEFPTVQLRINVEAMGAVQNDVLEARSTLGIIGSLLNLPVGLIGDALPPVIRFPVAARDHPLAQGHPRKRLPHRLLLDHVQILQSDRSNLTLGRDFSVYTGRTWRVSDLATKRSLLCAGLGWGYMPQHDIAEDVATGILRRLWVENLRDQNTVALVVVRRRDRVLGPAARWLLTQLIKMHNTAASTDGSLKNG
jgi:DNA-binding transcriptional LysR family regulator